MILEIEFQSSGSVWILDKFESSFLCLESAYVGEFGFFCEIGFSFVSDFIA